MEEYRERVKSCADSESTDLIPNGGIEHAEVLIDNLFSHAKEKVRVFSGQLNSKVFGSDSVVKSAVAFLRGGKDRKIEILLQDISNQSDMDSSQFLKACRAVRGDDSCEVRTIAEADAKELAHFVIMDELGYRIEPNKEKPTGIGCFNGSAFAKKLVNKFDDMYGRGVPLNV